MTIRVVVADDQQLVRAGLCGIVDTAADLTVVGAAADGAEAVDLARRERPDVVLMDVCMPRTDGLEATRRITESTPVRVLILSTFDLDEYVWAALRGGASGFLLKDAPPANLLAAIRVVAAGEALLAPQITRRLIAQFLATPAPVAEFVTPDRLAAAVTAREREVLALVAEGLSNSEIALRLHISPGTAKTHVANLLNKLDVRDRIQLVILALRAGVA
ncbi:response regulator transcription factor [Actinoplanes sp. NPDC026623]|uniref:response regulator transcription factor n=1 Tax=Actinoplanes sp. NPDC026623 TaxID=3155610 RepID=UPI0033CBBEF2